MMLAQGGHDLLLQWHVWTVTQHSYCYSAMRCAASHIQTSKQLFPGLLAALNCDGLQVVMHNSVSLTQD